MAGNDPTSPMAAEQSFAYRAQTIEGDRLDGHILAADADAARFRLQALGLRVLDLSAAPPSPPKPRAMRGDEFEAFNEQLAQLTAAGMPIEQGLRLIAQDTASGRLADSIRAVAADLESGAELADAFGRHAGRFPSLYGRLIEAGVRAGNLSAVLLNLGRHLQLMSRLRKTIWQATAYPLMVLIAAIVLLVFLGLFVIPPMEAVIESILPHAARDKWWEPPPNNPPMPIPTQLVFMLGDIAIPLLVVTVVAIVGSFVGWRVVRAQGNEQLAVERLFMPLPMIGPVLRRNLAARWCDAVSLGVDAGLDLTASIDLANEAVGSPALARDGELLISILESGGELRDTVGLRVLGDSIPIAMHAGTGNHDMAQMMRTLRDMYERQADLRLGVFAATLRPILVIAVGVLLGLIIVGLFLPMVQAIRAVTY